MPDKAKVMSRAAITILVVDDDCSVRTTWAQIFTQIGHEVRSASDGFSALREIRNELPSILLSDLDMPGMSGFELLSVVRRRFPKVQVIAMSGAYMGDDASGRIAADAFYQKGTGIGRLLRIVGGMSRPERQPVLRHPDALTPIWIPGNGHGPSGMPYVTIACPECLRAFTQVIGAASAVMQEAICTSCSSSIRYAVVQPTNAAFGNHVPSEVRREVSAPQVDQRVVGCVTQ